MIIAMTGDKGVLHDELQKIGVHPGSLAIFQNRSQILPLKIFRVRMPAANILKQEAISVGADCALNCGCVTGKVEDSDVILFGTRKQYYELLEKLKPMTFFGLPALCGALRSFLAQKPPETVLADGRTLGYARTAVMGIINLAQDSFYAGSRQSGLADILRTAAAMLDDGADILDLGAESTRPGAQPVMETLEQERLLPAVAALKKAFPGSIVSVDTYRASTACRAIECGADIINDVSAAGDPGMAPLAAKTGVPLVIMHMKGSPSNMQDDPQYEDVVREVCEFFARRIEALSQAGITGDKLIIDPGIGFGKKVEHNLTLMRRLKELGSFGLPVLLAASRKGTVGQVLGGLPPEDRLFGTVALSCQAVVSGAQLVRVHDVRENVQAIRMLEAVRGCT